MLLVHHGKVQFQNIDYEFLRDWLAWIGFYTLCPFTQNPSKKPVRIFRVHASLG
jgi:hypothetical protein